MVLLTAFLVHKGSSESKDSDDEMMLQLTEIRMQLDELARQRGTKGGSK
jgi:hypothetical protein